MSFKHELIKKLNENVFWTFSQPLKASVNPLGSFWRPEWQISLAFDIPEAWKRYPFRAEPTHIGYYRETGPNFTLEITASKD